MKNHPKRIFLAWLPAALAGTVAIGTAYALVQQDIRQSANDPQIELSEEIVGALSQGAPVASLFQSAPFEISKSLSVFGIAYDTAGKPVASSGTLNGAVPSIPAGVLAYARAHDDDRLTWQPAPGVRIAAVVKSYQVGSSTSVAGFILVGRSLREVELRESKLESVAILGWVVMMALAWVAVAYRMAVMKKMWAMRKEEANG